MGIVTERTLLSYFQGLNKNACEAFKTVNLKQCSILNNILLIFILPNHQQHAFHLGKEDWVGVNGVFFF